MSEVKKCPKCGGEMQKGRSLYSSFFGFGAREIEIAMEGGGFGDKIEPIYCKNCGYIQLFRKMKEKKEEYGLSAEAD